MWSPIDRIIGETLDLLLPPSCPACRCPTDGWPALLCRPCQESVEPTPGPVLPTPADDFDLLLSPFFYGGPLAEAIVRFKHGDLPALGSRLADMALARLPSPPADLVVPVPLHQRRLARRGFNQSAVIARRVARSAGGRFAPGLLERVRDTPTQGGLAAGARRANVRNAFAARRGARRTEGQRVLLVDDVWTTGATARECARVLVRTGSLSVVVYTLARVG